jgi:hypothetical protein
MVITGEMYYDAVEYREVMTFNYALIVGLWKLEVGSSWHGKRRSGGVFCTLSG